MAYIPTTFTRRGQTTVATSWEEHHQLTFDGWRPEGVAPSQDYLYDAVVRGELADFQSDPDIRDFRDSLLEFVTGIVTNGESSPLLAALAEAVSEAQEQAIATAPTLRTATLSASSPAVPELGTTNEWTVTNATTVQLPVTTAGSFLVLVKSGFNHITWPGGTTIFGATSATTNVWVTLTRTSTGWSVLIPSGGGGGGVDTGWIQVIGALSIAGSLSFTVGSAANFGTGWGVHESGGFGAGIVQVRRVGGLMLVRMENIKAVGATPSSTMFNLDPLVTSVVSLDPPQQTVPALQGVAPPFTTAALRSGTSGSKVIIENPGAVQNNVFGSTGMPLVVAFALSKTAPWGA